MQFSSADKSIYLKIVYYGPGLSGKTTNLETIHRLTDPRRRQPMVSLKTEGDRTLFFDLLPFDLGQLFGLDVRVKLYTVPGQIQYDTTRKQVLAGADGVVFVADSSRRQRESNKVMVRYLRNNLSSNGIDQDKVPLVWQWNKRDLADAMHPDELAFDLAWREGPMMEAVATVGTGVMETFCEITVETLIALARRAPQGAERLRVAELRPKVEAMFAQFIDASRKTAAFRPAEPIGRTTPVGPRAAADSAAGGTPQDIQQHLGLDDLLSEAISTNINFSERLVADASREQLAQRARRERQAIVGLTKLALGGTDPDGMLKIALRAALAGLELSTGSVLQRAGAGKPMREIAVAGRPHDPLNAVVTPGLGSLAATLLDRGGTFVTTDPCGELMFGQPHPDLDDLRGLVAIPLPATRHGDLLFVLYAEATTRDIDGDDVEFLTAVAQIAALALRGLPVHAAPVG